MIEKKYDFAFCEISADYDESLVKAMLQEVLNIPDDLWHFNEFRGCRMLSIMNPGGKLGKVDIRAKKTEMAFTEAADLCPLTKKFISENVMSWMNPMGRITILRTEPGVSMNTHVDCSATEIGTQQHKWRFVLNGKIENLYFLDENLDKHFIRNTRCYILDGGHAHGLVAANEEKITICIGSPWNGQKQRDEYYSRLKLSTALYVNRPSTDLDWIDSILKK